MPPFFFLLSKLSSHDTDCVCCAIYNSVFFLSNQSKVDTKCEGTIPLHCIQQKDAQHFIYKRLFVFKSFPLAILIQNP